MQAIESETPPRPRRALPAPVAVPEPVQVPEPVKGGRYAHGLSMKTTLETVCMNPTLTSKAKFIALVLAAHFPTIRPSRERLMALTGISRAGVARGLEELRNERLLEWKSGKAHQANLYTCLWL